MIRIYELLEKKFLTYDEVNELEECPKVNYEYCGMSGQYLGYNWEVITIDGNEYNIYFK